jgi:hypothetical protein
LDHARLIVLEATAKEKKSVAFDTQDNDILNQDCKKHTRAHTKNIIINYMLTSKVSKLLMRKEIVVNLRKGSEILYLWGCLTLENL